jgi:phosphopantothenoylcysteine decarboxylase/phosphopantothenate--cysteine ligase
MCDAVLEKVQGADALIMAAAVADYRPSTESDQKIKKSNDDWTISLTKTVDILEAATGGFVKVGFSAESRDLLQNAKSKVQSKGLDLIVANDITAPDSGFGVDTNKVALIDRELRVEELPLLTKYEVSQRVLDRVIPLFRD